MRLAPFAWLALASAEWACPGWLAAQSDPRLDSLASRAAAASVRYTDRRAAAAAGYRRIGTDFPGMGEHWLNTAVLLAGSIDPQQPTLLIYATLGERPTLLGLGFVTTTRGDSVPSSLPGWPAAWHEHSGLLSDESGAGSREPPGRGTHVWVSHVWTALPNPQGRYVPDNWALPFARVGARVPEGVDADAGRAMSLIVGGDEYLRAVLTDAGLRTATTGAAVDSAIDAARRRVDGLVAPARTRDGSVIRPIEPDSLRHQWHMLESELRRCLGPGVDDLLAPKHGGATRSEPTRKPS